jgi:hypothetical protein
VLAGRYDAALGVIEFGGAIIYEADGDFTVETNDKVVWFNIAMDVSETMEILDAVEHLVRKTREIGWADQTTSEIGKDHNQIRTQQLFDKKVATGIGVVFALENKTREPLGTLNCFENAGFKSESLTAGSFRFQFESIELAFVFGINTPDSAKPALTDAVDNVVVSNARTGF